MQIDTSYIGKRYYLNRGNTSTSIGAVYNPIPNAISLSRFGYARHNPYDTSNIWQPNLPSPLDLWGDFDSKTPVKEPFDISKCGIYHCGFRDAY